MSQTTSNHILVTGASGVLGGDVVRELVRKGVQVRGASRQATASNQTTEWQQCDLQQLGSIEQALDGVKTVIHCASSPYAIQEDRQAVKNLIVAARSQSVHLIYISIAGIENAAEFFEYYRSKLDAEAELQAGNLSHTIIWIAQFHPFVDLIFRSLQRGPFFLRSKLNLQPVDVQFAAQQVALHGISQTPGRARDVSGPERLNEKQLVNAWLSARKTTRLVIPFPALGPLKALSKIAACEGDKGGPTWSDWLQRNAGSNNPYLNK